MQAQDLQTVLLIQAVEETDRSQEVLVPAERLGATRSALSSGPLPSSPPEAVPAATEGFLTRRAQMLLARLRARAPAVSRLLALRDGSRHHERLLLGASFLGGLLLALLSGGRRIPLFAYPLLALLLWNLGVYGLLLWRWLGRGGQGWLSQFWLGKLYLRWVRREADVILTQTTRFNAPLAPGLRRFASSWWTSAQSLFELRARGLLHLCAALAAGGLLIGYYSQAGALHHPAGWSGHALGTGTARGLLTALYGPASALTGIAIPSADALGGLRWQGSQGGGDALPWVHLMAVTAALYILVPRLLAALVSLLTRLRRARELPIPEGLSDYTRSLLDSPAVAEAVAGARSPPEATEQPLPEK